MDHDLLQYTTSTGKCMISVHYSVLKAFKVYKSSVMYKYKMIYASINSTSELHIVHERVSDSHNLTGGTSVSKFTVRISYGYENRSYI